jgi:hypothetical protein
MPCSSEYLEPSRREIELRRAAKLLIFVKEKLGESIPDWLKKADDIYCNTDRQVIHLCNLLKGMDPATRDSIVYDAHNATSRDLADWWDEHIAADEAREAVEKSEAARQFYRTRGLEKLTADEKAALGLEAYRERKKPHPFPLPREPHRPPIS